MTRRERLAWGGLIAFALVLRLVALGARPPHHDEAIHCDFAYNLITQGTYRYDPTYHGPLIYFVMAPLMVVLGTTTAVGRLYPEPGLRAVLQAGPAAFASEGCTVVEVTP